MINRVVLGMAAGILLIALEAMKERTSYIEGFTLTGDQASDIGMVCGGDVTVYFQYISPEDSAVRCV